MAKTVTVVGATGIQGGSVVRALLENDSYIVRAITRNRHSDAAKTLSDQGMQVVEADLDDLASLKAAFEGSHAIFATTNFFEPIPNVSVEQAILLESQRGINLAMAVAATPSVEHYIWSTLPNARRITNGRMGVPHYDAKNIVDDYIKSDPELLRKTTFLMIAFYASNMHYPFYKPFPIPTFGGKKYIQIQASPASVPICLAGDARVNVGLFVRSILGQPHKTLPGKFVLGATETMTAGEMLAAWASTKGIDVTYVEVDKQTYYKMWPVWGGLMDESHVYWGMAKGKAFTAEEGVLTKDDLGVVGLVDTATAYAAMDLQ
ncbi:NAD(P)-binding domain protein [Pleurostoma richardsiae]|uniref:NAD(P)-binding domain protein n=1 Tax=Pleurostoma richardsiae TaxID=41990 RepID=A0AA38RJS4_9PEZI|nr:NAD(P)-binding domain protein [Pleurostoma richardsiae]